jgi:hypothetical protein
MDVKKFQDSRKTELDLFKKEYKFLKGEYSRELSSAISESDPSKQELLINKVQQINSELVKELHSLLDNATKGEGRFKSKELDDLTADIIRYQKEYAEIEKSKNRVETLKIIYSDNTEQLKNAEYIYYIYLAILILISFYICYLVLTTSIARAFTGGFIRMKALS